MMVSRLAVIAAWIGVVACAAQESAPRPHPRLLVSREELPSIRAACGLGRPVTTTAPVAAPGSQHAEYRRLREAAREIMLAEARPDDLVAPAVLHLLEGAPGVPDEYTNYVTAQLVHEARRRYEFDALLALDFCWDAIEPHDRLLIADRIMPTLQALDLQQSPLDHLSFYPKLCSLAAAVVLESPEWDTRRAELATRVRSVLSLAKRYMGEPFLRACRQRGAMPTSGEQGVTEEADLVMGVEIWRTGFGESHWASLGDSLARAMEHYFYADTQHPGLPHGFIHDDASTIPLRPASVTRGFVPAVPFVLARHASDPVATWYARRTLKPAPAMNLEADRYAWVRLLYPPPDAEVNRRACPLARHFGGGWVAMRSGWDGGDTLVLFDAGQPFWRARQHFDAGQFQIHRRGRLAIASGDDVAMDAVPAKGGRTLIGGKPGDWDDYAQATIAHNCITITDPMLETRLYGRPWIAMGNQRLIERDYVPGEGDITKTPRNTGRLTAFESNAHYSYAAADLTAAYPRTLARSVQRRILFLHAGAVLVLDRVEMTRGRYTPTFNLQMPVRPRVVDAGGGARTDTSVQSGMPPAFSGARQIHGATGEAGIWELQRETDWVEIPHGDGKLFVRTLLPAHARRRLMGGPMRSREIASGALSGISYYGGDPAGYEHRLWPATLLRAPNAAYELGEPTGLGPQFGVGSTWGRLDVSPSEQVPSVVFLHLLVPVDRGVTRPPEVELEIDGDTATVTITLQQQTARVALRLDEPAGSVAIRQGVSGQVLVEQPLTPELQPTPPLPLASP